MMKSCGACGANFNDGVLCGACKRHLEFGCAQITESTWRKMGSEKRAAWKCSSCRNLSPAPVSLSEPATLDGVLKEILILKRQLANMPTLIEDVKSIKDELVDLKTCCEFMGSRLDSFSVKISEVENRISMIESMQPAVVCLENEVSMLKAQLSLADQRSRLNNVEIKGVPIKKDENLFSVIAAISKEIKFDLPKTQINYLYRVPLHGSTDKSIIVSFTNRYTKEDFVAAARARKNLAAPDIGFRDSVRRIFVNDHLNAESKNLLNKVKALAKEKSFSYVWVKYGKIHVRKNDSSPIFIISQESDLNKIS